VAIDEAGAFRTASDLKHFYIASMIRSGMRSSSARGRIGSRRSVGRMGRLRAAPCPMTNNHDFVRWSAPNRASSSHGSPARAANARLKGLVP
jgi:hypothetical protein